jgi:hypothetical protein
MNGALAIVACLLVGQPPAPPLTVPAEVHVKTGSYAVIKATTPAERVRWYVLDVGLCMLPCELLADERTAVVFGHKAGTYRLMAFAALNGDPAGPVICKVIVGTNPGPDPVPPGPPPAPPPPPPPADPLAARLQAAYTAATDPPAVKGKQKDLLVGLYQAMAIHAQDAKIQTTGDLLGDLKTTADRLIIPTALMECRKVISAEVSAVLGLNSTAAMDAATRQKAVDVFNHVGKALDSCK